MISYRCSDLKDSLKKHLTPTIFYIVFEYRDEYEREKLTLVDILTPYGHDVSEDDLTDSRLQYLDKVALKTFEEVKKSYRFRMLTEKVAHELVSKFMDALKVCPRISSVKFKDAEKTENGERTWITVSVL